MKERLIGANSNDATMKSIAFINNGQITTIILNDSATSITQPVTITGLPPGNYQVSQSTGSGTPSEVGVKTVGASGTLTLTITAQTVVSIYPHTSNLPPVATNWAANPTFLDLPASSVALTSNAIDPELSTVTYRWTIDSFPSGANVILSSANVTNPIATGLTVAGNYVFGIHFSDGTDTTTKQVTVQVFPKKQLPIISSLQSRIPVLVTLPVDTTVLQGAAYDLEGDTLSMQFSIVSQPAGASAQLLNLGNLVNVIRTSARNMSVPGNYVFQLAVSNSSGTSYRDIVITVYPLNNAPVITSVSANPMNVILPSNSSQLSAITSDPNGDTITHWWMVQSAPVGSNPIFSAQGERLTQVSNLTIPGVYVFSLRVIDRTLFTQKNDTVVVKPDTTSNTICPGSNATFTTPISGTGITYQWQQNTGTGFTNLANSSLYNGVTTNTLILTNPPTSYYGYSYHCLVTNNGTTIPTTMDTLKFASYWIGTADSAWENPSNWSCGEVPDKYTDVILNAGVPNYPTINSNALCRSLTELYGVIAKINAGYNLTITY